MKGTTRERFAAKVTVAPSGCWEWRGWRLPSGYGGFRWLGQERTYAHRAAYRLFRGEIPEGHEIDHLCRNTGCVNPAHLEAVTPRENKHRTTGLRRGPYDVGDRCRRGHPRTPENVGVNARGSRICRPCHRAAVQRCRAAGG